VARGNAQGPADVNRQGPSLLPVPARLPWVTDAMTMRDANPRALREKYANPYIDA